MILTPKLAILLSLIAATLIGPLDCGLKSAENTSVAKTTRWATQVREAFPLCVCRDRAGDLWVATEEHGVWNRDDFNGSWIGYDATDGVGDGPCTTIACDNQGRIWVGQAYSGVSVWNGAKWQNYSILNGPLGEHVWSIAVSPVDGDVWLATNAGITRYSQKRDEWSSITMGDGLVSDAISCVSINTNGDIIIGTQCDGITIGSPTLSPKSWQASKAERPSLTSVGKGLPSNQINCLLVTRAGFVWAGTPDGLARSTNGGQSWTFLHGKNWEQKVKLTWQTPKGWTPDSGTRLMSEDYVTCLAEDESGKIIVGHRQTGYEYVDPQKMTPIDSVAPEREAPTSEKNRDYVRSISSSQGGELAVAYYGGGLVFAGVTAAGGERTERKKRPLVSTLPSPLRPSALSPADGKLARLPLAARGVGTSLVCPVTPLADDWSTRGDWIGRYGKFWACFGAMQSPASCEWGAGATAVRFSAWIGPNRLAGQPTDMKEESLRAWIHWLQTDNRNTLEMTPGLQAVDYAPRKKSGAMLRRQSEWDDHGEAYPMEFDGPHVVCNVDVPNGKYLLSLYDFNKDGHEGANRFRDYWVSIRIRPPTAALADTGHYYQYAEVAHARIKDFSTGVYKRFLVTGPLSISVAVEKNHSFNTILAGIFLDEVSLACDPYGDSLKEYIEKSKDRDHLPEYDLLDALDKLRDEKPSAWASTSRRAYREVLLSLLQRPTPNAIALANCYWNLGMFPKCEAALAGENQQSPRECELNIPWKQTEHSSSTERRAAIKHYLSTVGGAKEVANAPMPASYFPPLASDQP